jgi:NAD(P)-dependent dehydrogenase (short-subunit alcohol dehydrogenase family)
MATILITGANRGIGLALTQALLARGDTLFATCRKPDHATALRTLTDTYGERLAILPLEVSELSSIRESVEQVRALTSHLDILINNAALNPPEQDQSLEDIDFTTMMEVLRVNSAAPLIMAQQFLPLLRKSYGAKVINISSEEGSISEKRSGGDYAYRTSKAALNMVSRLLAFDLARYNITVVALDPGWVRTDMGGQYASLAPEESAAGMIRVMDGLTMRDNGRYLAYDGREHEW